MRRRIIVTAGLILLAALALPAQQRTTPQTFAAGTELVLVDFVVSDRADRPVVFSTRAAFPAWAAIRAWSTARR